MFRVFIALLFCITVASYSQTLSILGGASIPYSTLNKELFSHPGEPITGLVTGAELFVPTKFDKLDIMAAGKFIFNFTDGETDEFFYDGASQETWAFTTFSAGARYNFYKLNGRELYIVIGAGVTLTKAPAGDYNYVTNSERAKYNDETMYKMFSEAGITMQMSSSITIGARYMYFGSYDLMLYKKGKQLLDTYEYYDEAKMTAQAFILVASWNFSLSE